MSTANRRARSNWPTTIAASWMAVATAYVIYAASTYSGLYEALAELELKVLGSYDGTGTFLFLLIALCLPTGLIAPELWKKRQPKPILESADPQAAQRTLRKTMLTISAGSLAVGIGAAGLALSQSAGSQSAVELNLQRPDPSSASASRLLISGHLQPRYAIIVEHTINGSVTRTSYTPVTSPEWSVGQPVQYILRQGLGRAEPGEEASPVFRNSNLVQFGPVAVFHHALPGMVRTGFMRRGLSLASPVIVLDHNLRSASELATIVFVFGFLFAFSAFILWAIASRTHRLNSGAVSRANLGPSSRPETPKHSGPPRHWELRLGGELLAELFFKDYETPWISVTVKAYGGMQPFWRNFEDSETWPDHDEAIEAMLREIIRRGGFTLLPDGEAPTSNFTVVNFDERGANLRY